MTDIDKILKDENKRGFSDLHKYLSAQLDDDIKKRKSIAGYWAVFGFVGIIIAIFSIGNPLAFNIMLVIGIIGIIMTIISFILFLLDYRKQANPIHIYKPPEGCEIKIEECKGATIEGEYREFSKLMPSKEEMLIGFLPLDTKELCNNTAFVSAKFDNMLTLSSNIPVVSRDYAKQSFISPDKDIKRDQLMYLVARVGSKELRTFNEKKVCLQSSIHEIISAMQGSQKVAIAEIGYFDGMVTNEAFRSKINVYKQHTNICESTKDLTTHFPMLRDDVNQYRLTSQPCHGVSRHIGISTIAITADNQIVFFRQKTNNLIVGGLLVASGSGSADFNDIACCENKTNLKSIIQYSMARELCEEGGVYQKLSPAERQGKIRSTALRTMITGFFRWVDRCGKPEFVGVSKLELPANDIPGDNFEVVKYEPDAQIFKKEIKKLSDLSELKEKLMKENRNLSLSFYVALERLVTIASYENSLIDEERKVFDKVNNFLLSPVGKK